MKSSWFGNWLSRLNYYLLYPSENLTSQISQRTIRLRGTIKKHGLHALIVGLLTVITLFFVVITIKNVIQMNSDFMHQLQQSKKNQKPNSHGELLIWLAAIVVWALIAMFGIVKLRRYFKRRRGEEEQSKLKER
jgi:ABC-type Fe3+ transport system permease subunit